MRDNLDHVRGWISKGDSDLATVTYLSGGPGPFDTACFHAQQAVEKYLKAILAHASQPIKLTHDLELLDQTCGALLPGLDLSAVDLSTLTSYAVRKRYDLDFWPDLAEVQEAATMARLVRSAVMALLPAAADPTQPRT